MSAASPSSVLVLEDVHKITIFPENMVHFIVVIMYNLKIDW